MLPNPLHPAVVHFPIVLAVLLPLFVIGALWAIRRGAAPLRAWSLPLAMAGLRSAAQQERDDACLSLHARREVPTHGRAAMTHLP